MSNERFDKLMKKQLESVSPTYQARAWDRFQKRLPSVGFWPWLGKYGGWALSCLMLAGWVSTLYVVHENQTLTAQLSATLRQSNPVQQPVSSSASSRAESSRLPHVDTVYVVKRTIIEHRHFYRPTGQFPTDSVLSGQSDSAIVDDTGENTPIAKPSFERATTKLRRQRQKGKIAGISPRTRQAKASQLLGNRAYPAASTQPLPTDSTSVAVNTNQESSEKIVAVDTTQRLLKVPEQEKPRPDSVAKKESVASAQEQAKPSKQNRPPFRLSALKPRVGIESIAIRNGIGVGPTLELFLNENLGLSVGLQAAQLHSQTHRDMDDFNASTGKDFVRQYQSFLPAQFDRIDDISIHTSIVSLPIMLKYYVPIKHNWSLLFQTGTSFDLAAYQQVHYDSEYKGTERYNSFEVNAQRSFFHDFSFGTGIQYHKSRISGQVVPYYLYDFRSMANTPGGSNFGLKASVWLDLFN
ncbi:outer membrane beta-barrel protein [Spirosoma litoris]